LPETVAEFFSVPLALPTESFALVVKLYRWVKPARADDAPADNEVAAPAQSRALRTTERCIFPLQANDMNEPNRYGTGSTVAEITFTLHGMQLKSAAEFHGAVSYSMAEAKVR
jgi:hypothetical protein